MEEPAVEESRHRFIGGESCRVRTGSFGVDQPYTMDPAAPFGGVEASGIGRELGREGLESYVEPKAISGAPRGS